MVIYISMLRQKVSRNDTQIHIRENDSSATMLSGDTKTIVAMYERIEDMAVGVL